MIRAVMASSCGAAAAVWPRGKSACSADGGLVIASLSACSACERRGLDVDHCHLAGRLAGWPGIAAAFPPDMGHLFPAHAVCH